MKNFTHNATVKAQALYEHPTYGTMYCAWVESRDAHIFQPTAQVLTAAQVDAYIAEAQKRVATYNATPKMRNGEWVTVTVSLTVAQ